MRTIVNIDKRQFVIGYIFQIFIAFVLHVNAVGRKDDEGAFTHLGDATKSLARTLAEQAKSGGCRVGQPTGFNTLDSHINGLMPGNVTVIAARPGVGKTSFAMIDYKTGKNAKYADMKQLDLMAGALFVAYPELEEIKSGLLYVVSKEFPRKVHTRDKLDEYMSVFEDELYRLDAAMDNGVWNPKSGPLCGWCPVTTDRKSVV